MRLIRLLLAHGDYVVACLPPHEIANDACSAEFRELANECRNPSGRFKDREGWKDRIRGIRCDGRFMGQCVAAVAEAVHVFGRIDIVLCCSSEALVGAVEETVGRGSSGSSDSSGSFGTGGGADNNLVRDQFETVFFAQVHFIKAALPQLRTQRTGHIMVLSSIGGHIGTPGMPLHTAATWALEGYCDSLAYEIAPFNIKVTIVQPQTEVQTLTNKIVFAAAMPEYEAAAAAAFFANVISQTSSGSGPPSDDSPEPPQPAAPPPPPGVRDMLLRVLNAYGSAPANPAGAGAGHGGSSMFACYPRLPPAALDRLVLETVHALTAIGGHENPPTRHIVGFEASAAVQDKLKTVSEELEDFVEASLSVDIFDSELKKEAREGRGVVAGAASSEVAAEQTAAQQAQAQAAEAASAALSSDMVQD